MPRRDDAAPPSPWPPVGQIPRDGFRFTPEQRAELIALLPARLEHLTCPPEAADCGCQTIAELIVKLAEEEVQTFRTVWREQKKTKVPLTPASGARAVCDLSEALKPFAAGSLDTVTMEAVAAALGLPMTDDTVEDLMHRLGALIEALRMRKKELLEMRVPSEGKAPLRLLCGRLDIILRQFCEAIGAAIPPNARNRFILHALDLARITHPDARKHPERWAALVNPPPKRR
ncbi:MAG: hypothetical protein ACREFP_02815 [Acetobacteraceae bacterium]